MDQPTLTIKEATVMSDRKYVHVPFNRQVCPGDDCDTEGSIPGIKRHAKFVHGEDAVKKWEDEGKFQPLRTSESLAEVDTETIREAVGNRGLLKGIELKEADRDALVEAITK